LYNVVWESLFLKYRIKWLLLGKRYIRNGGGDGQRDGMSNQIRYQYSVWILRTLCNTSSGSIRRREALIIPSPSSARSTIRNSIPIYSILFSITWWRSKRARSQSQTRRNSLSSRPRLLLILIQTFFHSYFTTFHFNSYSNHKLLLSICKVLGPSKILFVFYVCTYVHVYYTCILNSLNNFL
jgi:hypothetical protein